VKLALYGLHRGSSADPDTLVRRARLAEDTGIDELWVGDHIALPVTEDGDPADQPRLEAVVTLAHLAAVTERVGLGFGVIVLPQRQPVLLAKQLASVPPPRNSNCGSRWVRSLALATHLWLVRVPFPLGAVGEHAA
jgi:hypothetical protein